MLAVLVKGMVTFNLTPTRSEKERGGQIIINPLRGPSTLEKNNFFFIYDPVFPKL